MKFPWRSWRAGELTAEAEQVLRLLAAGATLKVFRCLNGEKVVRLHPLDGPPIDVSNAAMRQLKQRRLLDSNMKFPAATYLLTQRGRHLASALTNDNVRLLGAHGFQPD